MKDYERDYESEYLGTDHEYREFEMWIKSDSSVDARRNNESETDLLEAFRDSGCWKGALMAWAFDQVRKEGLL